MGGVAGTLSVAAIDGGSSSEGGCTTEVCNTTTTVSMGVQEAKCDIMGRTRLQTQTQRTALSPTRSACAARRLPRTVNVHVRGQAQPRAKEPQCRQDVGAEFLAQSVVTRRQKGRRTEPTCG